MLRRTRVGVWFFVSIAALSGCVGPGVAGSDSSVGASDAAGPLPDAAQADTAVVPGDAATPPTDGARWDASPPPADASTADAAASDAMVADAAASDGPEAGADAGAAADATSGDTGAATAALTGPLTQDFGTVDVLAAVSSAITVVNQGTGPSGLLAAVVAGDDFGIESDGCSGRALAAGADCTVGLRFAPSTWGTRSGELTVQGATGETVVVALSGVGRDNARLTISLAGTGGGSVSAPPDQSCSSESCVWEIPRTTSAPSLTLAAATDGASTFDGWGGDCTGASCTVVLDADRSVIATFSSTLTVTVEVDTLAGQSGAVTSDDGRIDCNPTCRPEAYRLGSSVHLTATPASGSSFVAWRGACRGIAPSCTFTVTSNVRVVATFGPPQYAFVTSTTYRPGMLGGLAGADTACAQLAIAAGLPGHYAAWLSSSTVSANRRVGDGGWVRTDGRPFLASLRDYVELSSTQYPPRLDERGNDLGNVHSLVVTGSDPSGNAAGTQCGDYTSTSGSVYVGEAAGGSGSWSSALLDAAGCTSARRLYCFRYDLAEGTPRASTASGRLAFVSAQAFKPSLGIAGADALCMEEAAAATLPNADAFVALLATPSRAALSRLSLDGLPWKRPDQVLVVERTNDLVNGRLIAPISVLANGQACGPCSTWTGATAPDLAGSDDTTCADWTDTTSGARAIQGVDLAVTPDWFNSGSVACDDGRGRLLCFER